MTYRYTYKITCLVGKHFKNHYYYGQHTTDNLNDGYVGSGKKILRYFKKYGAIEGNTYIKEILDFYSSSEKLNQAEYELIGDKYYTDPMCMNLRAGGMKCGISDESRYLMSIHTTPNPEWVEGYTHTQEERKKMRDNWHETHSSICGVGSRGPLPETTRQAISKSTKGIKKISKEQADIQRQLMIGRKWISKDNLEKHVYSENLDYWLNLGWNLGRLKKYK